MSNKLSARKKPGAIHSKEPNETVPAVEWRHWCRLCAKEDVEGNINVFSKTEQNSFDNTLATAIGKYFWVNMKADDTMPTCICEECHTLIVSLVSFTERVNKVQAMFSLLQNVNPNNPLDANEWRLQYDLLEENFQHIIKLPVSKEQEFSYLEEDDNAHDEEEEEMEVEQEVGTKLRQKVRKGYTKEADLKQLLDSLDEDDDEEEEEEEEEAVEIQSTTNSKTNATSSTDEVDVEDSDLFKELKYKLNEEGTEDEEEEQLTTEEDENVGKVQTVSRKSDKTTSNTKTAQETPIVTLKRKRGRPPKDPNLTKLSEAKRRKLANEADDPDYDDNSSHVQDYRYECKVCYRKYKNATSYRKHMTDTHNTAPDIPDFVCEKCPEKVFPTEKQLAVHKRTHLPLEEKLDIPCPYCDRKFTKIAIMRQHVSGIHNNEKPFVCDECGRALRSMAALNEHKLIHTTDCPYECEVCQKRFKNKARLKTHADIHTETQYVCTECGLRLNTRRTLKMHMLVHSDEKQFQCNFCGSAFKRSKALKNHLILHTGMRPYKCNFCNKTFSNGSNCRSHKKKIHPKELAEEEALGRKAEPAEVPKLEELRSNTRIVKNPREVNRTGGLPKHLRELLIKAEECSKSKNKAATQNDGLKMNAVTEDDDDDTTTIEIQNVDYDSVEGDYDGQAMAIKEVLDNEQEEEDDEEEEDGDFVIYEIIDEI